MRQSDYLGIIIAHCATAVFLYVMGLREIAIFVAVSSIFIWLAGGLHMMLTNRRDFMKALCGVDAPHDVAVSQARDVVGVSGIRANEKTYRANDPIGLALGVTDYYESGWSVNPVSCPFPSGWVNGEPHFHDNRHPAFHWNRSMGIGMCVKHRVAGDSEGVWTAREIVNALFIYHNVDREDLWAEVGVIEKEVGKFD